MISQMENTAIEWLENKMYVYGINPHTELFKEVKEMDMQQKKFLFEFFFERGRDFQRTGQETFEDVFNKSFSPIICEHPKHPTNK